MEATEAVTFRIGSASMPTARAGATAFPPIHRPKTALQGRSGHPLGTGLGNEDLFYKTYRNRMGCSRAPRHRRTRPRANRPPKPDSGGRRSSPTRQKPPPRRVARRSTQALRIAHPPTRTTAASASAGGCSAASWRAERHRVRHAVRRRRDRVLPARADSTRRARSPLNSSTRATTPASVVAPTSATPPLAASMRCEPTDSFVQVARLARAACADGRRRRPRHRRTAWTRPDTRARMDGGRATTPCLEERAGARRPATQKARGHAPQA